MRQPWWMDETVRVPATSIPGFFAGLVPDNQAATTLVRHGIDSKLQGHALRKEMHGACASPNHTTRILALGGSGQRSTRQAPSSWPTVRGELLAAMRGPVLAAPISAVACPILARRAAAREYHASLPIPTTRETVEASRPTARTAHVHEYNFLRPQLLQTPS